MQDFIKLKQQLEILWNEVEKLERETPGPGPGGTTDYDELTNKPSINGNTLTGNKTSSQLGLITASDITDAFTPSTISIEDGEIFPSASRTLLTEHKPIMINGTQYWFLAESGVDYLYGSIPYSGAYPTITYFRVMKVDFTVEFHQTATDTVPTSNSDNFITSGGVYTAIQSAGGGGIETVELVKSGNSSYWPEDKMSVLDSYNQLIYLKTSSTLSTLCFIVHDTNAPNAKVGFILNPVTYDSTRVSTMSYTGFSVNTTTRLVTFGNQIDNIDVNNVLTSFYTPIGTAINANTNLDGSIVCTKYYCTAANAATLTNCPTTDAFILTVEHTTSTAANTLLQKIITVGTTPTVYIRTKSGSSTWNSWYKFEGTVVS